MADITFRIDQPTPLLNEWQRWHWQKRRRYARELAWEVQAAVRSRYDAAVLGALTPLPRCRVEIERHSAGKLPDWDGLYGGVKPLLDCLVVATKTNPHGVGLIVDDNPVCVEALDVWPHPCKSGEQCTVVAITKVERF